MEVETKFSLGNEVFYYDRGDGKIYKDTIRGIHIVIGNKRDVPRYNLIQGNTRWENELFGDIEECKALLIWKQEEEIKRIKRLKGIKQ